MKLKNILIAIFLFFALPSFSQGKLGDAKDDIKSLPKKSNSRSSSHSNSDYSFEIFLIEQTVLLTYSLLIEFQGERDSDFYYFPMTEAPYLNDTAGNYFDNFDECKKHRIDIATNMIAHNRILYGNNLHIKYHPSRLFNFDFSYLQLYERLPNQRFDLLRKMTFMANYERIRLPFMNLNWGIGATYMGFGINKWGPAFGLNAEVFFWKPLSANIKIQSSYINLSMVNSTELELRFHKKRHFFSTGYSGFKFGRTRIPTIGIGYGVYL